MTERVDAHIEIWAWPKRGYGWRWTAYQIVTEGDAEWHGTNYAPENHGDAWTFKGALKKAEKNFRYNMRRRARANLKAQPGRRCEDALKLEYDVVFNPEKERL